MSWIDRFLPGRKARSPKPVEESPADRYLWRPAPPVEIVPTNSSNLPRFQSTAGDQLDARGQDLSAMRRARLRNAYTPAQPVTDRRMFAGRTKVLTALIQSIEDQRLHVVIYGERGIGKTSLLHVLSQAAAEARYLVVYVTCGAKSEFDETIRAIAAKVPLMFHREFGPTSEEGERGDNLASVLPPETLTVRSASDALAMIEGTRVLVILDEYDRAGSEDFRRSVAELLKSLSDQAVRVQFLIAGVAANLAELVSNVPSIQRNVFALQVPKMTAAEIRSIVKNGEAVSDVQFDDPAIQAIITRCIGFPYLATMISHRAALIALDQGREKISADDVFAATRETVDEFKGRVSRRTILQIEPLVRNGLLGAIGALAGAAQSTGGWFAIEDITPFVTEPTTVEQATNTLETLVKGSGLIEMREDEFDRVFRFAEPSAPVYLWLLSVQGLAAGGGALSQRAARV